MIKTVTPYKDKSKGKGEQVEEMFDNIAPTYDFLNRLFSLGIDRGWRKKAIKTLRTLKPKSILDVATGTGDLAIAASKLHPQQVIGIDLSDQMLAIGIKKVLQKGLNEVIELRKGDSEKLDFVDNTFDAVTVAFGVRNFESPIKGLKEMHRVLKNGGQLVILEFSNPKRSFFKPFFMLYFKHILPAFGRIISKDKKAYSYLSESVGEFPERDEFCSLLNQAGFNDYQWKDLTLGVCCLYTAKK